MSEAAPPAEADSRLGHTTGVVLRDEGTSVHALRVGDQMLVDRATRLLAEICEVVVVVDRGPLGADENEVAAVIAALEAGAEDQVLVLSADRPLLTPDLLIGLAGLPDADAAIPRDAHGAHPTCARYRRASVLPALRNAARAGATSVEVALSDLQVAWLEGDSLAALDRDGSALGRVADEAGLAAMVGRHPERAEGAWPGHPGLGLASQSRSEE